MALHIRQAVDTQQEYIQGTDTGWQGPNSAKEPYT